MAQILFFKFLPYPAARWNYFLFMPIFAILIAKIGIRIRKYLLCLKGQYKILQI
jgi:hypothetical protein